MQQLIYRLIIKVCRARGGKVFLKKLQSTTIYNII